MILAAMRSASVSRDWRAPRNCFSVAGVSFRMRMVALEDDLVQGIFDDPLGVGGF